MTEKRFTLEEFGLNFIVNDNGRNLTAKQTVDRLNELNDENEQLKKDLNSLSHNWALMYEEAKNKVEELSKENKKLKSINNQLEDRLEESGIGIALKMEDLE